MPNVPFATLQSRVTPTTVQLLRGQARAAVPAGATERSVAILVALVGQTFSGPKSLPISPNADVAPPRTGPTPPAASLSVLPPSALPLGGPRLFYWLPSAPPRAQRGGLIHARNPLSPIRRP